MNDIQALNRFMGGRSVIGSPRSETDFIKIIRQGFPTKVIVFVMQSFPIAEVDLRRSLGLGDALGTWLDDGGRRFEPRESELIYRFAKVAAAATEVFESRGKAAKWMLTENVALGDERPINLLDTSIGFQAVLDVLHRIEHGVYS